MQEHEIRVVQEQVGLEVKMQALGKFIDKDKPSFIDDLNWQLLNKQYAAMSDYNEILKQRISLFK